MSLNEFANIATIFKIIIREEILNFLEVAYYRRIEPVIDPMQTPI